jgi:L-arabinokinase
VTAVAYYISGHGYGHAVRSAQVIRALQHARPEFEFYIRTTVPRWLLQDLRFPVSYHIASVDVGIIQQDSLLMDLASTLRACAELHRRIPELVREEIAFIGREKIRLILGDIPPLCFEVAARAAVPSIAIGNFDWSWIYRAYLREFPSFLPLIEEMESFYRQASLALAVAPRCPLEIFPNLKQIPLISRRSGLDRSEARSRFGLPAEATVVLLTFGGFGLERLPLEKLERAREILFVTTGRNPGTTKNLVVLPEPTPHYEDLIRAADVVVSKPGYGIVADAISHQVPLLYTSRADFPEYPYLVEALNRRAIAELIPQDELLAGNLKPYVERLLDKERRWPAVALNGAEIAAESVLELVDRG